MKSWLNNLKIKILEKGITKISISFVRLPDFSINN
ncbi:hypothetical protein ZPR_1611 [Zunongwangia profunda SM-A87]|uniref:Uncharacterized protein n=1 Tax=Zunongwangia profunda (strain DSM 18752 / CCTCC AB 206139 / SM-A87) TaxID=655815 RepID=D5BL47_ZUNPS|nr:hypothetical protein ZPR_1611 [Zunongwangia profunda SM-A87]